MKKYNNLKNHQISGVNIPLFIHLILIQGILKLVLPDVYHKYGS